VSPRNAAGRVARTALGAIAVLTMGACVPFCGIGAHFSLSNARVDSVYTCPNLSNNRPYDVHGSIDVDNSTANRVTIKSMTEMDELVKTGGDWNGPKTAKSGGPITNYEPRSIDAGAGATIRFSVVFDCTDSGAGSGTFGEFAFKFTMATSNGTFSISAGNHHRLAFA
jgi:hypothetical protein